jgi:hypothetical protein
MAKRSTLAQPVASSKRAKVTRNWKSEFCYEPSELVAEGGDFFDDIDNKGTGSVPKSMLNELMDLATAIAHPGDKPQDYEAFLPEVLDENGTISKVKFSEWYADWRYELWAGADAKAKEATAKVEAIEAKLEALRVARLAEREALRVEVELKAAEATAAKLKAAEATAAATDFAINIGKEVFDAIDTAGAGVLAAGKFHDLVAGAAAANCVKGTRFSTGQDGQKRDYEQFLPEVLGDDGAIAREKWSACYASGLRAMLVENECPDWDVDTRDPYFAHEGGEDGYLAAHAPWYA